MSEEQKPHVLQSIAALAPLPVSGYKPQSQASVGLVNVNKQAEERILRIIDDLAQTDGVDGRWLAIGKTQIEQGFMAVNRAVFRPARAALPEDADQLSE